MWSSEGLECSVVNKQPSESPFFFAVNSLCCAIKAVRKVCSLRSTLVDGFFVEIHVNKLLIISFCDFCRCNMNKGLLECYKHLPHIAQGGLVVNKAGLKSSDKWQNEKVQTSHHATQISIKNSTGERTSRERKKNKKEIIIRKGFFSSSPDLLWDTFSA